MGVTDISVLAHVGAYCCIARNPEVGVPRLVQLLRELFLLLLYHCDCLSCDKMIMMTAWAMCPCFRQDDGEEPRAKDVCTESVFASGKHQLS